MLGREDLKLDKIARAKRPEWLPTVFDRDEIERPFAQLEGTTPKLVAVLLYGSGLRLLEALRLRVQDIEFGRHQIIVRNGKGAKDHVTLAADFVAFFNFTFISIVSSLAVFANYPNFMRAFG